MKKRESTILTTQEELDFIFEHGFTIRSQWISPMERVEFRVSRLGVEKVLAYRKSERAAYNFIVREVARLNIPRKKRTDYYI